VGAPPIVEATRAIAEPQSLEIPFLDGEVVGLDRLGELLDRTLAPTSLAA
jgi:hypothetical protein